MSTSDWKAELRRRIEVIREKKETERDIRQRVTATAAAVVPAEEHEEEPAEEPLAEVRALEVVQSREVEESPADSVASETEIESAAEADSEEFSDEPAFEEDFDPVEAEAETPESFDDEDEPTLFPIQTVIEEQERIVEPVADVEDRKQPEVKSAAPAASVLDPSLDSYTPLDHNPAMEADEEPDAAAAAPEAEEDPPVPHELNIRRLLAAGFDAAALLASEALIILVAGALMERGALDVIGTSLIPLAVMFGCLHFLYYVVFTSLTGQTPGKLLLGIKVSLDKNVDQAGIGIGRAILRWFALVAALIPLGIGYFWIYSKPYGCGWHDILLRMHVEK
ncbi:MAG TPA: RDD family protein [Acidobacteriota bacterium]|nr:RDD family protein [Acidobacteriota bacterium]